MLDWDSILEEKSFDEIKKEIKDLYQINSLSINNYFIVNAVYLSNTINYTNNYNTLNNLKKLQCELNLFLSDLAVNRPNFFVLDIISIIEHFGISKIYDKASWIYAKNRYSKFGMIEITKKLSILINAICDISKKCLVLDLDNTIWGGVISEDGITGIVLGGDREGKEYQALQKAIRIIKDKGVVLCICSKNDFQDVENVFNCHPEMILKLDDFVVKKINWKQKDINIKEIAKELDIAEESIVFLDDSPFERELVKRNTNVNVPEFPRFVEDIREFILDIDERFFSKLMFSKEDLLKTKLYTQNVARFEHKKSFQNFEEFIKSLDICLVIGEATNDDAVRLSQLTQKTNQFNLTNKKYTENDLKSMIQSSDFKVFFGEVSDKFGQYGKVLLLILEIQENVAHFDTFLMSCRVIGRLVEDTFIREITKKLKKIELFTAEFIPSKKNQLVEVKLKEMGFEFKSDTDKGKYFYLKRSELSHESC